MHLRGKAILKMSCIEGGNISYKWNNIYLKHVNCDSNKKWNLFIFSTKEVKEKKVLSFKLWCNKIASDIFGWIEF